jgi:ribosomal protein S8
MPEFYQTVEVDAEVEVSVDEFYDACSSSEKEELVDLLKDDGYLKDEVITSEDIETYMYDEFNIALQKLSTNRLVLSIEEEEIIKKIASRL